MEDPRKKEFEKIRVGNCKEQGSCSKVEDLNIYNSDPDFMHVQESYISLSEKEGYGNVNELPKDQRIMAWEKLRAIRKKRILDWQEKQIAKHGVCPHHNK